MQDDQRSFSPCVCSSPVSLVSTTLQQEMLFLIFADDVRQLLEWLVIICKVVFQHGSCLEGWQGGTETRLTVEKADWVWEHWMPGGEIIWQTLG